MSTVRIGSWSTRRLASAAIASGVLAVVALFLALADSPSDAGGGDDGWVLGLLLVLGPPLAAGATRSVAGSVLLRPVGAVAAVVAALSAAVHVGLALDERGVAGWLYGAPALVATALVVAAVAAGRDAPRSEADAPAGPAAMNAAPPTPRRRADDELVDGPPLDVLGPLRSARAHAARSVVAWLIVTVVAVVVAPAALRLLGWPTVEATLRAEVVSVRDAGDVVEVVFNARHDGDTLRWTRESESTSWEVGDRPTIVLGDDGRLHLDRQRDLVGLPLLFPITFTGLFAAFAVRRLWGVAVAAVDAARTADEPRLGYVATLRPPRQWRPLAAVWWQDPTQGDRLARPDAVYRADDETGEDVESSLQRAVVHRAWVDTGSWPGAKPRWVGTDEGVVVPHRRALLGRWQYRMLTRRAEVEDVVPLRHTAPTASPLFEARGATHALGPMVVWRLLALPVAIGAALLTGPGGEVVRRLQ